ncbi:transcriptional regulator [Yersinia enterocolitica]|uniref:winged helix-turn-helix domain-containing protein n=1 Tax=Yersinia enterocolitica TaxID=630 RepID=UPI0021E9AB5D|nr:winged helix-turn-helix domain-containing protein [Yersinia enterocolitica]EKN3457565.1 winged helix-turn-helix domain-containing protein [Yersinia enterocolitica]EKN3499441.1 winged helix-turn-helix domain-containing protein [Yersinia enterocolitica]EKN3969923.1 winged helix-turn-helix domain-containing protein [Yersinia enterocolitica]EKN4004307.1 winged helix-turn-helix domain-containing protein [Yersinia enterocolitica]EKN4028260.1 winged helix-turn-helix domain-containing protein [Yers
MSSPIVLDKLKNVLVINNEAHALSKNEVLLLEHLYLRGGEVIPRDDLISTCWPDRVVSPVSLPVAIKHIRDVLRKATQNEVIKTHKSVGYSFQQDSLELAINSAVYEQQINKAEIRQETPVENSAEQNQQSLLVKAHGGKKISHNYTHYFMAIAIIVVMALFISGEEDVISFTDSTTRSTIITNVPPALDNSAAALPKVKNGVIFKDNFGSVIVCDQVECQRK